MSFPHLPISVILISVVALGLTGCSSPTETGPTTDVLSADEEVARALAGARDYGFTEQIEILADGEVTEDEYLAAFSSYESCLSRSGITIKQRVLSPFDNLTYRIVMTTTTGTSVDADDSYQCDLSSKLFVEAAYQATHVPSIDTGILRESQACLRKNNVPHSGTESKIEDFSSTEAYDAQQDGRMSECLSEAAWRLYPGLPTLPIG